MARRPLTALTLLLAALAPAGAARASATQESLIQDDTQLLQRGPLAREAALDDVVTLGADGVRALARWRDIAPAAGQRRPPRGFAAGDPAAYPAARWDPLDGLVRGAAARRLAVLLSPSTPVPDWASDCRRRRRVCRPDATEYGRFVRALGRRYSGAYRDENEGGGVLPRVARWSFSNEPNQPAWLRPQLVRRDGVDVPEAAVIYRALVRRGIDALEGTGHADDRMLLGETAPIGRLAGRLETRPMPPGTFLRTLLCIDADGHRLAGSAARVRGCGRFERLRVTGYAHHPYTRGGSKPPPHRGKAATEITIASAGRLEDVLDDAAARGRLPRGLPIHYTEYGFQTNPPDLLFGVSLTRQAQYLNQSDWIAYRNPRIRTVAQYKLRDDPAVSSFQSGLRFWDGTPKPAFDAYRLALWVSRKGATRLRVYGQVRPLAAGATARLELENAPFGSGEFRPVATFDVGTRTGAFVRSIARREGRFRLRWGALLSREAVIAPR